MKEGTESGSEFNRRFWLRFRPALTPFHPGDQLISLRLLSEASTKLVTAYCLAVCRLKSDVYTEYLERSLARANSLGSWVQIVRQAAMMPAWIPPQWQHVTEFVLRKHKTTSGADESFLLAWTGFEDLRGLLGESADTYPAAPSYMSILEFLVRFRNSSPVGHGAQGEDWTRETLEPLERLLLGLLTALVALPYRVGVLSEDEGGPVFQGLQFPLEVTHLVRECTAPRNGLCLGGTEVPDYLPIPRFVVFEKDSQRTYFHNGAVNIMTGACEYICYADGSKRQYVFPEISGEIPLLPKSETSALTRLHHYRGYNHNLPGKQINYVSRPVLEKTLLTILNDRTHRIVTLHGEGGTGKTSLALYTLNNSIADGSLKDCTVLWFSARDIDLVAEGPKYRRRDVSDLDSILTFFMSVVLGDETDPDLTREMFCEAVSGKDPYLLVMDNFETLDEPKEVYDFLDRQVMIPSKVLVTSREREFVGDYSIEVRGMDFPEAKELILRASREALCEPAFQDDRQTRRVWDLARGNPYQMKLLVGLVAGGWRLEALGEALGGRADVLEALFRRSFDKLSGDGQWLYLVLGGLNVPLPSIAAEVVLDGREIQPGAYFSTREAVRELQRYALLSDVENSINGVLLALPHVSARFAKRVSGTYPYVVEIERDIEELKRILKPGVSGVDPEAMLKLLQRHTHEKYYEIDDLLGLALRLCERHPGLWKKAAEWFAVAKVDPGHIRDALRRALEEDPGNTDILLQLAKSERALGNREVALSYEVRAAELQADNPKFIVKTAEHVNMFAAEQGLRWPVHRKSTFCDLLIALLEPFRSAGGLPESGYAALAELKISLFQADVAETHKHLLDAVSVAMEGVHQYTKHEASEKVLRRAEALIKRHDLY